MRYFVMRIASDGLVRVVRTVQYTTTWNTAMVPFSALVAGVR